MVDNDFPRNIFRKLKQTMKQECFSPFLVLIARLYLDSRKFWWKYVRKMNENFENQPVLA